MKYCGADGYKGIVRIDGMRRTIFVARYEWFFSKQFNVMVLRTGGYLGFMDSM
jgi:hypothetical protein